MKTTLFTIMLVLTVCSATAPAMKFPAYNGDVYFDHRMHRMLYECSACHQGPPQHFDLDHESGHKLCVGCHRKENRGPAKHCSDCHKTSDPEEME